MPYLGVMSIVATACTELTLYILQEIFTTYSSLICCKTIPGQKGVHPSHGHPFLEGIQGNSLNLLMGNMPSGCPVFNVWLKAYSWGVKCATLLFNLFSSNIAKQFPPFHPTLKFTLQSPVIACDTLGTLFLIYKHCA